MVPDPRNKKGKDMYSQTSQMNFARSEYQYQGKNFSGGSQWFRVRAISGVQHTRTKIKTFPEMEIFAENEFLAEEEFRSEIGFGNYSVSVLPLGF